ncbi:HlyD family secretion protein [Taibaiella sp. KBW10]|uniref:HlyD family secretion protein n=1 Tax=Taibaiella sp. KBW10 TaxID=2153357 RepID=UPI000F594DC0|nr:HlyD family secretion protein [Taibaiella sp. KBW10]RQO30121.1 HlyD family secretion protein [Taibaiella sp. KBW10]
MENNNSQNSTETLPKKKQSKKFALIFGALVILGGSYGFYKYVESQKHEDTDDAQVSSRISPVIPRVGGYVAQIKVQDNQYVKKGDTLLVLDDRDYAVKLTEAEAQLISARSSVGVAAAGESVTQNNVVSSQANTNTIDAQIESAKVNLWRTQKDYERFQNLIKDHSVTQQQFEQAEAAYLIAQKQLGILNAQKQAAGKQTASVAAQSGINRGQVAVANASIAQAEAGVVAAKLNLSYTVVLAAVDGHVGTVNIQPGQMVQPGQALFQIIPDDKKWVVANFKETQLTKMKIGQKVSLKVDAYPNQELEGTITSFAPATGSKTSLLPPDNASGNFIKTVQRVPVRIDFNTNASKEFLNKLSSGMNVFVDVHLK